jgi:hypothetical protein
MWVWPPACSLGINNITDSVNAFWLPLLFQSCPEEGSGRSGRSLCSVSLMVSRWLFTLLGVVYCQIVA